MPEKKASSIQRVYIQPHKDENGKVTVQLFSVEMDGTGDEFIKGGRFGVGDEVFDWEFFRCMTSKTEFLNKLPVKKPIFRVVVYKNKISYYSCVFNYLKQEEKDEEKGCLFTLDIHYKQTTLRVEELELERSGKHQTNQEIEEKCLSAMKYFYFKTHITPRQD